MNKVKVASTRGREAWVSHTKTGEEQNYWEKGITQNCFEEQSLYGLECFSAMRVSALGIQILAI